MRRLERLLALIVLLLQRRQVSLVELAERFRVSERTLYRDLVAIEAAGVPLGRRPGGGYFLPPGFEVPPLMFTAQELASLNLAASLAESWTDESVAPGLVAAVEKIRTVLPQSRRRELAELRERTRVLGRRAPAALRWLQPIQEALLARRVLSLEYFSSSRHAWTDRRVEPLGLAFYGDHWHLLAFCCWRKGIRDFRVDRIAALRQTTEVFSPRSPAELEAAWARLSGTFESAQEVRVRAAAGWRDYILDKSHYWLVGEEAEPDGSVILTYRVPSLEILAGWLLAFAPDVEAISPPDVRRRMRQRARELAATYAT